MTGCQAAKLALLSQDQAFIITAYIRSSQGIADDVDLAVISIHEARLLSQEAEARPCRTDGGTAIAEEIPSVLLRAPHFREVGIRSNL